MDVEQIQKINALALELLKQGLASDRESAIEQAQQIYKGQQGSQEYSQMRETMQEVKKQEPTASSQETADDLSPERVKDILKQNTDYIVKKLREFQEKVENLEKEMSALKNKVQYSKLPTVREVVSNEVPAPQQSGQAQVSSTTQQVAAQQAAAPRPDQPGGNHPRSGSYNDQDVSIEKFFYMGSR